MTKKEKLLMKAKTSPENLTFNEFISLLDQHGWIKKRQAGSHITYAHYNITKILVMQTSKGKAKIYQVKQFLETL